VPSYIMKVSTTLLYQLCSTCYTSVRIKNYLKSTSVIKVGTTIKLIIFAVSKDEWNTREGTGRSINEEYTVHTVVCQKAPSSPAEETSNSKKMKP